MNRSGSSISDKQNTVGPGGNAVPRSKKGFWLHLALDVLVAGVILAVFYLFLGVLPQHRQFEKMQEAMTAEAAVTTGDTVGDSSEQTDSSLPGQEAPLPAEEGEIAVQAAEIEPAEEAEEGNVADISGLTLRERFAEFFTEETVKSSTSYTSPNISVQITTLRDEEHGLGRFTAYIADIHVASVHNLQAGFPSASRTAGVEIIAQANHAVLAVNGDYYLNIHDGLIVRNGALLQDTESTRDLCVLYEDGSMKTYAPGKISTEELLSRDPYQVWSFGPELLDENGAPKEEFNTSSRIVRDNPRTAIGYYEPGHYCLVVVDGRAMGNSSGASLEELASLMADLGCSVAYNLDGGGSSTMVYNNRVFNLPSGGGRGVSDVVMVCELPEPEPEQKPEPETEAVPLETPAEGEEAPES